MRRVACFFVLLAWAGSSVATDLGRARSEALQGDQAYEAGDFPAAIAHYETALAEGLDHADVHYNLGNAHYKNGELGLAIACYQRALLRSPRHEAARANLEQARQVTRDEAFGPLGLPLFLKPLGFVYDRVSLNEWAIAALFAALLCACAAILAQWWRPWRARARGVVVATLALLVVCAAMATLRTVRDVGRARAVVTVEEADVRSGPGTGYNVSFKIHEGLTVFVSDRREQWAQIHLGGKLVGWVPLAEIEIL